MKKIEPSVTDYYDSEVVKMIVEKYGHTPMDALRQFVCSRTHEMLEDRETGMTRYGAGAIFEIWETEQMTSDPRNSIYISGE